jgi:DNA polymerase zeta
VVRKALGALFLVELISPIVRRYIARLTDSLNYAIAISLKRDPQSPRSRYVRAVILVKGIHFYGFNTSYSPFLKIHIVDPALVSRAVAIMQSGSVMGTPFHTFESHLSYVLQFLCDYGLYGCGWIQLEDVWQRGVDGDVVDLTCGPPFKPSVYFRQSRMALEFDTIAPLIMNRRNVSPRHLHHKLVIPQPPSSSEPLVLGVRELWDDERRRRAAAGLPPSPDLPQDPSANSREKGDGWAAEARWWDQLRQRIERDPGTVLAVSDSGWERWIMTTFESVEALWEDNYRVWKPTRGAQEQNPYAHSNGSSPQDIEPVSRTSVEVDEALLSSQELSSLEEQGDAPEPNLGTGDKDNSTDEDQVEDADAPSDIQIDEHSRRGTPQPPQRPHSTTPVSSQQSNKERLVTPRKRRRAFLEATTE